MPRLTFWLLLPLLSRVEFLQISGGPPRRGGRPVSVPDPARWSAVDRRHRKAVV